ncbi:L,D-transpeptidase [Actinokineospora bangkokensis]|uniref:L,D-TPase catalytic domain-containing protein n=1 Tax=Actinokineospora bangkokensis TaxID=1193682 RepID=A0A1Q9LKK6_9PSEU|nr:L,D-transpeptidase [Actinokineospora bangkokensis]OLR92576.1 hypothetical protein BJP25_21215 [Actinokineospora bangkokensis]
MTADPRPTVVMLPQVRWDAHLPALPRDPGLHRPPHPLRLLVQAPVTVHTAPKGPAVARLPPESWPGLRTWVPVVDAHPGWVRVLLPSLPDGASGWVELCGQVAAVPHHGFLVADRRTRTLTAHHGPNRLSWPCGVGKATTPTPRGRTYVLGEVRPDTGLVRHALVLASHQSTHLDHGAGLSAVGLHTWPTASWGLAGSDGSVLVPPEAMPVLTRIAPPGTAVLIH